MERDPGSKDRVEERIVAFQATVEQTMGVLAYKMLQMIMRHHREEVVFYSIAIALGSE